MAATINSFTQVPSEMYVERSADTQIRKIISEMARPGYVLVARQMGKTSLLLHTKELLQDKSNIFVYVDFSTMAGYSEDECLNLLIDIAIEANYKLFEEAEKEIQILRTQSSYKASRMFNRELRLLLRYVDKIVFILDEIDALIRTEYSDRVFSLIRGHYYASTNFPELKRATYILSGVIEPKNIIKDSNISPFNIGEKIYMGDFSKEEFLKLISNSDYLKNSSNDIKSRLFYWTKGQPRMSWDLCTEAEKSKVTSVQEIDDIVQKMYLTFFDKAPVDAIREKIKTDTELRDALIQLSINKGMTLSDDVKSKLYLEGIIDYNQTIPEIKNPILVRSLSYDWLLEMQDKELNYLSVANKSIYLERDYQKAISHLEKFLELSPSNLDDVDKAKYLLSEAYFRTYNSENTVRCLDLLTNNGRSTKYYNQGLLLRGHIFANEENYQEAEECYRMLIRDTDIYRSDIYFKGVLGLVNVLILQNKEKLLKEAETLLRNSLTELNAELFKANLLSTFFYNLACIEETRGNKKGCVIDIDNALKTSHPKERPRLLYIKILNVDSDTRSDTASELFSSLSEIKSRPELEDFDMPLGFNLLFASQIISLLMVEYPQYDLIKYLRFFFYDSKENSVLYMNDLLKQSNDPNSDKFFEFIKKLTKDSNWHFDFAHLCNIGIMSLRDYNNPDICFDVVNNFVNKESVLPEITLNLFSMLISYFIKVNNQYQANYVLNIYRSIEKKLISKNLSNELLIDYYECYVFVLKKNFIAFSTKAVVLFKNISDYKKNYNLIKGDKLSMGDVDNIISNIKLFMSNVTLMKQSLSNKNNLYSLGRNTKVKVRYLATGQVIDMKFKKVEADLNLGLCVILNVYE